MLDKDIGSESCAESWEIADHNQHQSVVANGAWTGKTLNELVRSHGRELLGDTAFERIHGDSVPPQLRGRFPLLLKFLDANRNLSVQVHPDNQMGATLNPPDFGKTEAWYVLHAEPGAKIYAGLAAGVTESDFRQAILDGTTDKVLHSFEPTAGECVLIQAGTLHAIGEGLLIAEIQQASNTTFRIFDWNRVDRDGHPRALHIAQGLRATNFELGPVSPQNSHPTDLRHTELLVESDKFLMHRVLLPRGEATKSGSSHCFTILTTTRGSISVGGEKDAQLKVGDTTLLPAAIGSVEIKAHQDAEFLQISLP